ncbi:hypothetical protein [Mesorhizobium sp. M0053]
MASNVSDSRVAFTLSSGNNSISGTVSEEYFDIKILPVVESLLGEIAGLKPSGSSGQNSKTNGANPGSLDMSVKMIAHK